jgi:hypothetical protein
VIFVQQWKKIRSQKALLASIASAKIRDRSELSASPRSDYEGKEVNFDPKEGEGHPVSVIWTRSTAVCVGPGLGDWLGLL